MFDATLQVVGAQVEADPDGDHLFLVLGLGIPLPLAGPAGPVMAQGGIVRIPLAKENALALAESLKTEGKKLRDPSKLVSASPEHAERLAKFHESLRNG